MAPPVAALVAVRGGAPAPAGLGPPPTVNASIGAAQAAPPAPSAAQWLGINLFLAACAVRGAQRSQRMALGLSLQLELERALPDDAPAGAHAAPLRRLRRIVGFVCHAAAAGAAAAPALRAGALALRVASAAGAAAAGAAAGLGPLGAAAGAAALALRAVRRARRGAPHFDTAAPLGAAAAGAATRRRTTNEISIVTFNIRGIMDRWDERRPLLADVLRRLDADVFCFQEVLTGEFTQERQILAGSEYQIYGCRAALDSIARGGPLGAAAAAVMRSLLALPPARAALVAAPPALERWRERKLVSAAWARALRDVTLAPFFGNSIASRLPTPAGAPAHASLLLGGFRAAQRVCFEVWPSEGGGGGSSSSGSDSSSSGSSDGDISSSSSGGGSSSSSDGGSGGGGGGEGGAPLKVWVVCTHLDHASAETRARQAQAIVDWMEPLKAGCAGVVITGDLNAPPGEAAHAVLQKAGYHSASQAANGREPEVTWPSGIVAPLMDEGEPHCADYAYVFESPGRCLRVAAAAVAGDAPSPGDATLYPSDHLGLHVTLSVGRRSSGGRAAAARPLLLRRREADLPVSLLVGAAASAC